MPTTNSASVAMPEGGERRFTLAELCSEAANHVAKARVALFSERIDTDGALDHLDQAIFLLQRMAAHGRSMGLNGKARSA